MAESIITLVVAGLIGLIVFLTLRGIVLWYFKINEMSDTLFEIRDLLVNIAELSRRTSDTGKSRPSSGSPASAHPLPQRETTPPPEHKPGRLSEWRKAGGVKSVDDD
jgi:hypothetical protein